MANTKISALTSGNPAAAGDLIPIDRSGANYKITAASIAALSSGPAASTKPFVDYANPSGAIQTTLVADAVTLYTINLPAQVVTNIIVSVHYSGVSSLADVGLYDTAGNLLCHSGPTVVTASSQTPQTFTMTVPYTAAAGTYLLAITTASGQVSLIYPNVVINAYGIGVYTTATASTPTTGTLPATIVVTTSVAAQVTPYGTLVFIIT